MQMQLCAASIPKENEGWQKRKQCNCDFVLNENMIAEGLTRKKKLVMVNYWTYSFNLLHTYVRLLEATAIC